MGEHKTPQRKIERSVARLLDANLNRAREGIRVVEDSARFLWDDKGLYRKLRRLRHDLHEITTKSFKDLVDSRDSEKDSGRKMLEGPRPNIEAVIASNMRRAQEAVRVLEEYGKVFSHAASSQFKRVRYKLYTIEKEVLKQV